MEDKEELAIRRIIEASKLSERFYQQPLLITTSGGKDSSVCLTLAMRAGIKFEVMHNHTTADAPETVRFIREQFKELESDGVKCTVTYPTYKGKRTSMWNLIPQKLMPPTRVVRYCCAILKERGGRGRYITTGVRWAESKRRAERRGIFETMPSDLSKKVILNNDNDDRRRLFETCKLQHKAICNPIIDWTDADVWDYIQSEHIPLNPLYKCGFNRVGCIGCPMAGTKGRYHEFAFWPKYRKLYLGAFERMLEARRARGKLDENWNMGTSAEDVYHWWMEDGVLPGQIDFEEYAELMAA